MIDNKDLKALIKQLVFSDKVVNQADFALKLGYERSTISGMTSGKKPISESFANKVCEIFDVNLDWMRTGKGEMLKIADTEMYTPCAHVPLLPMSAQGGSLNDFVISVKSNDCEMVVSPINGAEYAMPVSGDSMSPEYPSGSQILIKRINEKAFIDWGKVYVLDTCNGTVIKKLMPSAEGNKDRVRCVSINPEYPPFEVGLCDVYGVYKVLLCMSIK